MKTLKAILITALLLGLLGAGLLIGCVLMAIF